MALDLHLLEASGRGQEGEPTYEGIHSMVVVIDDAVDTDSASILARGATLLQANGINVPNGYFDTERQMQAIVTGVWDAAGDFTAFGKFGNVEVIA